MNETEHKKLDALIKELIKETPENNPSPDFTDKIMLKIEVLNSIKSTTYQPLISKKTWVFLCIFSIVLIGLLVNNVSFEKTTWLTHISIKNYIDFQLPNLSIGYKFPRIFLYGFLCFSIMILIQIPLLKNYFDNSLKQ